MSPPSQMSSINVKNVDINDMNNYIDIMSCPLSYNEQLCNKPDGLLDFMFFKHPHLVRHRDEALHPPHGVRKTFYSRLYHHKLDPFPELFHRCS